MDTPELDTLSGEDDDEESQTSSSWSGSDSGSAGSPMSMTFPEDPVWNEFFEELASHRPHPTRQPEDAIYVDFFGNRVKVEYIVPPIDLLATPPPPPEDEEQDQPVPLLSGSGLSPHDFDQRSQEQAQTLSSASFYAVTAHQEMQQLTPINPRSDPYLHVRTTYYHHQSLTLSWGATNPGRIGHWQESPQDYQDRISRGMEVEHYSPDQRMALHENSVQRAPQYWPTVEYPPLVGQEGIVDRQELHPTRTMCADECVDCMLAMCEGIPNDRETIRRIIEVIRVIEPPRDVFILGLAYFSYFVTRPYHACQWPRNFEFRSAVDQVAFAIVHVFVYSDRGEGGSLAERIAALKEKMSEAIPEKDWVPVFATFNTNMFVCPFAIRLPGMFPVCTQEIHLRNLIGYYPFPV
ncbi:hypothetical protein BXZ70DRAFT_1011279 [Cristinia sonorae]|uniref:Uncharacterized protein n=1 Tax=Cristinia sonorae TaxID=1940300 RepID=A0A8K0UHW1_9AGAR|nr:hypothetical protein BXZ70DRAFT_1011279 [Cristinia sonorae]